MRVTVKSIKGESVAVETAPEETVRELKRKLQAQFGAEPEGMKLIHKGKHLEDEKQLQEFNIADGDTLILMLLKKHTAPALTPAEPAPLRPESAPSAPLPAAAPVPAAGPLPPVGAQPPAPVPAQLDPSNEIVQGSMNKARMIEELAAMGFPAAEAERALVAAFYNRDRAVDYLLSGIPEAAAPPADAQSVSATSAGSNQAVAEGSGEALYLDAQQMAQLQHLVSAPEFENIRQQAAQNPEVLGQLMSFLQQQRPELFRLLQDRPELLMALVSGQVQMGTEEGEEGAAAGEGEAPEPQLSPEDMTAIRAMRDFGFSEQQCIEAYLICDKNQELALNYLLDGQHNS